MTDLLVVAVVIFLYIVPSVGACACLYKIWAVSNRVDTTILKLDYIAKHLIEGKP